MIDEIRSPGGAEGESAAGGEDVACSGRNLLIFSDGTGQAGGLSPDQRLSNVYKLFRASRIGPDSIVDPAL